MMETEIKSRLAAKNRCYYSLRNILKSSLVFRTSILKNYKTFIKLILIYSSARWTTAQNPKNYSLLGKRRSSDELKGRMIMRGLST